MKLSLCMIVKDDSEVNGLKNALISVINYVDTIHIVANGEETQNIEHLIGFTQEKYPQKEITYDYLAWTGDFSAQRNFVASKVPKDSDYYFWLDADDILVGGEYLRGIAENAKKMNADVVFLKYWYGCTFNGEPTPENLVSVDIEHYRERLIRPGTITWKKRIHETPVPVSGQKDNYTRVPYNEKDSPIAIMHTATLDDSYEKMDRNRELLEKELADERKEGQADPRTILYLMKIYAEIGDKETLQKCIEMGHEYLHLSGWDEERANALDIMAICSSKLGQHRETINYLHRAIDEYPFDPLHYVRLAMAYFAVDKHKEAKHWLTVAGNMDMSDDTAGIRNLKELKVLFAQMLLKIAYNVDKDLDRSVEAAELLLEEQPIPENEENLIFLKNKQDLYKASEDTKRLFDYLESIGDKNIVDLLDTLPIAISNQPWAIAKRKANTPPRIWGDKEICYFANFGGKHFEKWDGRSISKGIGGSETAVIRLAEDWVKRGYRVTVFGDPEEPISVNGVMYLPWYYFNKADKFNIFIQWRSGYMAPTIKCNKFLVDLHDIVHQVDYNDEIMNAVDGVMFKSQYHRYLLPDLPDSKAIIVGNGINETS